MKGINWLLVLIVHTGCISHSIFTKYLLSSKLFFIKIIQLKEIDQLTIQASIIISYVPTTFLCAKTTIKDQYFLNWIKLINCLLVLIIHRMYITFQFQKIYIVIQGISHQNNTIQRNWSITMQVSIIISYVCITFFCIKTDNQWSVFP